MWFGASVTDVCALCPSGCWRTTCRTVSSALAISISSPLCSAASVEVSVTSSTGSAGSSPSSPRWLRKSETPRRPADRWGATGTHLDSYRQMFLLPRPNKSRIHGKPGKLSNKEEKKICILKYFTYHKYSINVWSWLLDFKGNILMKLSNVTKITCMLQQCVNK